MITSKKILIAILVVPILLLAGLMFYKQRIVMVGKKIVLPIEGYDPRDLLAGHYLIYRVNYGIEGICGNGRGETREAYICVEPRSYSLERPTSCSNFIRGECSGGQFKAGIERFYVPEGEAKQMEQEVRSKKASIVVSADGDGWAQVTDLLIDGVSWRDVIGKASAGALAPATDVPASGEVIAAPVDASPEVPQATPVQ